jgi:poly-gamma-glutamate biosynthesis protein PgsC/CapC
MHDYLFSNETVRLAFLLGIVASMLIYERWHLTTGSIVVPGYVGVYILQPLVLVMSLLTALITYHVVNRVLPRWVLLYGRTKFSVGAVLSIALQTLFLEFSPSTPYLWERDAPLLVAVGYVVPALIAHDMGRQGFTKTLKAVGAGAAMVGGAVLTVAVLLPSTAATGAIASLSALAFEPRWVPPAVLISAAASWALLHNHRLRSGGYVGPAYLALLSASAWQLVFLALMALVTYAVVMKGLARVTILFGRRKFSSMLLVSGALSWLVLWFGVGVLGFDDRYWASLAPIALTPLFVPGLLANDIERGGIRRTVQGAALGGTFVFAAVRSLAAFTGDGASPWPPLTVTVLLAALIFDAQIVQALRWLQRTATFGVGPLLPASAPPAMIARSDEGPPEPMLPRPAEREDVNGESRG